MQIIVRPFLGLARFRRGDRFLPSFVIEFAAQLRDQFGNFSLTGSELVSTTKQIPLIRFSAVVTTVL